MKINVNISYGGVQSYIRCIVHAIGMARTTRKMYNDLNGIFLLYHAIYMVNSQIGTFRAIFLKGSSQHTVIHQTVHSQS